MLFTNKITKAVHKLIFIKAKINQCEYIVFLAEWIIVPAVVPLFNLS